MKKISKYYGFGALFISLSLFGQKPIRNISFCDEVLYDTIRTNLIVELNASGKFYSSSDATVQGNLIYVDRQYTKKTIQEMYSSDTVFITYSTRGLKFFRNKDSCLNMHTLSDFIWKIEGRDLKRKERKRYRKSVFSDKNGAKYLRISAYLRVVPASQLEWVCPKVYCKCLLEKSNEKFETFCTKVYSTTFFIADIFDFKFRPRSQ